MFNEILVGVHYFAGWWKPCPNKWHGADGQDWRPDYPRRVPLLGETNDQATMDREIAAAAEHGVDFFSILWYYNDPGSEREPNARFLNRGLIHFVKSPNASRLKFAIEFCNHPPFEVTTDDQWAQCVKTWIKTMRHLSYLRVDDRLVFKVHSWHHFWIQSGKNLERCCRQLDSLRHAVREAGLGKMLIGCGVGGQEPVTAGHPIPMAKLFDFTATYMDVPPFEPCKNDYPYSKLAGRAHEARRIHDSDAIPWVPYLPAGWNPRPWSDPRASFVFPTSEEWKAALRSLAEDFEKYPRLGLPLSSGGRQKAFTIYAWNEFGEGGIVAPTQGEGAMKLEAIQEVFGQGGKEI